MKRRHIPEILIILLCMAGCTEDPKPSVCEPDCSEHECGPDGCGGSCGSCTAPGTQCSAGKCQLTSCVPSCKGRECGSNGCGGICGTCPSGITCDEETGLCQQCVPDCTGKNCGDDGCGGSCGTCTGSNICSNHQCIDSSTCVPKCDDRECGDNECGGSCGSCPSGNVCSNYHCVESPKCTPNCVGRVCGSDGCSGQCGTCVGEQLCDEANGQCVSCIPNCTDRKCGPDSCGGECGKCGNDTTCNESTGQCMPYRVKGRLFIETQTVYYDAYTLPTFDKKVDVSGRKIPLSLRDADGKELSTTTVGNDGSFEMALTRLPVSTDWISIIPAWYVSNQLKVVVLKASQNSSPHGVWEWTIKLSDYASKDDPGDLGDIRIKIDQASGALYLYQVVVQAFEDLVKYGYTKDLGSIPSMAVVWEPGVTWNCGTCFFNSETEYGKTKTATQMLVGAGQNDESAWGIPTILHEYGHYILALKQDTSDGGLHYMTSRVEPTLAWSEGWATFYSLMMMSFSKNTPITQYWRIVTDEDGNDAGYWLDYAHLFDGSKIGSLVIPEPNPEDSNGMKQDLSEAWISYMLWDFFDGAEISDVTMPADPVALGSKGMFNGLSSDRYVKNYNESRCTAGTDFVDYVDALICNAQASGNSKTANDIMDMLIDRKFPYDRSPVCK